MRPYSRIIDFVKGDGSTIEDLIKRSGLNRKTVTKHLTALEQQGFLEKIYRIPRPPELTISSEK